MAAVVSLAALTGASRAQPQASAPAPGASAVALESALLDADRAQGNAVVVNHRPIVTFRATLMGRSPRERAIAGNAAVKVVMQRGGPARVTVWQGTDLAGLQLDGIMVFYLAPDDLDSGVALAEAAQVVSARLQLAVDELRETQDWRRIGIGAALSAGATLIAYLLVATLFAVRRRLLARLESILERWQPRGAGRSLVATYWQHAHSAAHGVAILVTWGAALVVLNVWITFVLRQFALTRYWGERATEWMFGVIEQFASAIAEAVPGLVLAILIFLIGRLAARANSSLMQRIERGELQVTWLDADTAGPTRRIGNFVIWLFVLALAYPFLPGSSSDAFKGVSVLAGLMLSLGASSVVGQIMSGLALMYSRSLRVGEYVQVGDVEGTVTVVGLFAIKIHTGMGEEVSVPNSVVVGGSVRNFSRLAQGKFILHTAVTIGYSTPWRQVHAMLLEAARRTPGVAQDPKPYVVQTALSDFYVEYRLCAHSSALAPARRAEALSELHGHVQDVFNENGVQIMSPHYMADTAQAQVVAPAHWDPALAPAAPASKAPSG
ncbi:MAG TPA: mechanosensitive ion channel domain-containing protein [Burkholderiaceae bacterium]|nr:mechanosensitive ion channel domain-containing protein [Burkholderiaceae bacterium]HSC01293.1 mechanosensitive ion channel domain-containing protein [Burkholderiaceae bacterium]